MLKHRRTTALALLVVLGATARAQDDADGLRRPERLTIGTADQFLGQIAPDDRTLYFASNRNTATELFHQDLTLGTTKLLFDEGADVTWPRVSPDGKRILYVSFREEAAGQLCVRDLPKASSRRCLHESGAVQAEWLGKDRVVLLGRPSAQGDMRVSMVHVGRKLTARALFDRNLTGPAVSPDGRWLVYTPVERYVPQVGPGFAARAGRLLQAQRLDHPEIPPMPIALDAPGLTGQPAFSLDGKALYFVQFVSDTNQDGLIDGSDNGVLFTVPFPSERDDAPVALSGAVPDQLTDASWNCQYPSPAQRRLIATCARGGHLDVYGIALEGMLPPDWDEARLRAEIDVTSNPGQLLLMHARLLKIERDPAERRAEMVSLVRLHLQQDEFDAADFHAQHVAALKDKSTSGIGSAMRLLCEHRRALRARERGKLSLDFVADSKARLDRLAAGKSTSAAGLAARAVVRSEIADVLGDKTRAREELEKLSLEGVAVPAVVELYADRADALYRSLDEREPLVEIYERLSEHPALSASDRLAHARAAVRARVRGLPYAEAKAALERVAPAAAESERAFALELGAALLEVRDARPSDAVRDRLLALYKAQTRPERRRAVMLDAVQRCWDKGAQDLTQRLSQLYVDDAPKGSIERRRAARLYKRLLEDRAYQRLAEDKKAEARDDFFEVARRTGSFESWAGYIDRRLQEDRDKKIEVLAAEIAPHLGDPKGPVSRFVNAYLFVRRMPRAGKLEAEKMAEQATGLLRGGWAQLKDKPEAMAVFGALQHERFLHSGDRAAAQRASANYLIALDLAKRNPRYRAMLLGQYALLQAQVGNWRIALDYFQQRAKLPFDDKVAGLANKLIEARTLLHLDREEDAAKLADEALAIVDRSPKLERYRALCVDRAALYNLAADQFERALALYERVLPTLAAGKGLEGERNRLVARLARAAAALGAGQPQLALDTVADLEKILDVPGIAGALRWPYSTEEQAVWTYRLIAAGLRAKAHRALGMLKETEQDLRVRQGLYQAQLKRGRVDAHLRALALVESQLAELALERKDGAAAMQHAKAALDSIDAAVKSAGGAVDRDQLDVLWITTEARLQSQVKLRLKLRDRLGQSIDAMAKLGEPKWRTHTRMLEVYLGMLGKGRGLRAAASVTPSTPQPQ